MKCIYLIVALAFSLFYGFNAQQIHAIDKKQDEDLRKTFGPSWVFHQFWFNFFGALVGWVLLGVSIQIVRTIDPAEISIGHVLIFIIGVVGVVGYIPKTIHDVASFVSSRK
jgi:hypothetical protein